MTDVVRFSAASRAVHRSTGILMLICIVTAAILYNGSLAVQIGHRRTIEQIHVWTGFVLVLPMFLGLFSRSYRDDLSRLNRFSATDRQWLRDRDRRRGTIRVGKFNAGQKLNAALSCGAMLVLLATGTVMYFPGLTRLSMRTGATFTHDWFALAIGLLVCGHILFAFRDSEARRGMRTGSVSRSWAEHEHPAWAEESGNSPK